MQSVTSYDLSFQPSPDPKAGCDLGECARHVFDGVSTLTRPEGRVRRYDPRVVQIVIEVSTLTRPEGRVRQVHRLHQGDHI